MEPGTILRGKYRIERLLGAGGMGQVFVATHLRMGQKVAVKILNESGRDRSEMVERFAREARAAAQLTSDHVVRILDVDETEERVPFFVMELLVGEDLDVVLRRDGVLPIDRAVDVLLEAMEGIAEAHARGIVHRDLKPANLFLAKRATASTVKVLDFGISKSLKDAADVALTTTQSVIGSPLYMSPEQLRASRDVDARSDVWSLGIVLFQLLTGTLPFSGTSATAVAACIAADAPTSLREKRPDVPAELEAVVLRCLEKNRDARFASVALLAKALAPFAAHPELADDVERAATTLPSSGAIGLAVTQAAAKTGRKTETLDDVAPPQGASTEAASVSSRSVQPTAPRARSAFVPAFAALGVVLFVAAGWTLARQSSTSTPTSTSTSATAFGGALARPTASVEATATPVPGSLAPPPASTEAPLAADAGPRRTIVPASSGVRPSPRRNPLDVDIK